jgi:hypothetical protein
MDPETWRFHTSCPDIQLSERTLRMRDIHRSGALLSGMFLLASRFAQLVDMKIGRSGQEAHLYISNIVTNKPHLQMFIIIGPLNTGCLADDDDCN